MGQHPEQNARNHLGAPPRILPLALLVAACSLPEPAGPREFNANSDGVTLHLRIAGDPSSGNVLVAIHGRVKPA